MDYRSAILGFALIFLEALLGYYIIRSNKPAILLPFVLLLGLILRIVTSLDLELHQWDECYHALVAKNLTKNWSLPILYPQAILPYDYKDWSSNYIWLHKPPLTLWAIALAIKTFGCSAFAVRIPSIIFSTISIYLVYNICAKITKKEYAIFAAYLFCINGFLIDLCSGRTATDHVDTLFLFLVTSGLQLSLQDGITNNKSYYLSILIGVITGLAVLTKWLTGMFIIFMYGAILILYKKQTRILQKTGLSIIIALIIFLPWNIFTYINFRQEFIQEQLYNISHVSKALEGHDKPFWYFIDVARINWNELIYFHFIIFIYATVKRKEIGNIIFLLWLIIPYILFSMVTTKMPAYVVICAPAIFYIISYSLFQIKNNYIKNIFIIISITLGIRYSIERIKPFKRFEAQRGHTIITNLDINKHKNAIVFGCNDNIQTMFYYDIISYPRYPSIEELNIIKKTKTQIIAIASPELPEYMRNDSTILKINKNFR